MQWGVFTAFSTAMSQQMQKPHFFKVLLGDFEKSLRIPPYFVKNFFNESTSDNVIIHDANGDAWNVGLERINSDAFLTRGWSKFVKDHLLRQHEFVVFRYEGNMRFSVVLVFDTTACEKDGMLMSEHSPERPWRKASSEANQLSDICCHCKKIRNNETEQDKVQKAQGFSSDAIYEVKTEKEGSSRGSGGKGKHKMEQSIDVDLLPRNKRIKTEPHSVSKVPDFNNDVFKGMNHKKGFLLSRRRGASEAEAAAKLFSSKFPFFVTRILPSNISFHHSKLLPAPFAREHLPREKKKITLHCPNEKDWVVVYIPGDQRSKFVGGWSAFMHGNCVQEGDYCAFELVCPDEFRVTIFRANKMSTRN